jgi:hypothetical protein
MISKPKHIKKKRNIMHRLAMSIKGDFFNTGVNSNIGC